jgi:uncharacterized damage-inducible protein DinB
MSSCPPWIEKLMLRELDALERELALLPDEQSVWRTLPGVTNAVGTLTLHVCGNLRHYLGAVLGGSGYVRDRQREFAARGLSRDELREELRSARAAVALAIARLDEAAMTAEYPEPIGGHRVRTGFFLHHLAVHLAWHLGQVGYLRRILTGDPRTSGAIGIATIAEDPAVDRA